MATTGLCDLCALEDESESHALLRCPRARDLMQAMKEVWLLPDTLQLPMHGREWLLHLLDRCSVEERDKLLLILWRAWNVRNQITHNEPDHSIVGSVQFLQSYYELICSTLQDQIEGKGKAISNEAQDRGKQSRQQLRWVLPRPGRVKINVDAAYFPATGAAGVGIIARNETGTVLLSSCRVLFHCADAEEAELIACKEGLRLALQWVAEPITLETDCKTICSALNSTLENRSHLAGLLQEVKELATELRGVEIVHCHRSQNRVSHALAKKACLESLTKVWLRASPECVVDALASDCNPAVI